MGKANLSDFWRNFCGKGFTTKEIKELDEKLRGFFFEDLSKK